MTRTLQTLIPPMNFIRIKDFIYDLLVAERNNQNAIALAPPHSFDPEEVQQMINFAVYKDTFSIQDAAQLPAMMIKTEDLVFPAAGSNPSVGKYKEDIEFKVGCFAVGTATRAGDDIPAYTADQNANMRLSYLISQAAGILCASINWLKQADDLIEVPAFSSVQRVETPDSKNEAEVIMGSVLTFNLRTTEIFEPAPTVPLKEIGGTLQIADSDIRPFFKYLYNQ